MQRKLAWAVWSAAGFLSCLVVAVVFFGHPSCWDCAVPWGWPVPYMITEGFVTAPVWLVKGLVVDLLVAGAFSVAAGRIMVEVVARIPTARER